MSASAHWTVVREVISSTDTGAQVMGALPGLVRRLLDEDAWREFVTPDGRANRYERFTDFVGAPPPRGLGGRVSQLLALCGTDEELAKRVRSLAAGDVDPKSHAGGDRRSARFQVGTTDLKPSTTRGSADDYTARLKRDAESDPKAAELLAPVLAGKLAPTTAARRMGWRKPTVQLGNPDTVARRIRETFTPDQIARLVALLIGADNHSEETS